MLRLEARPQPSRAMSIASPLIALALTVVIAGVLFVVLGKDPIRGLSMFFVEPLRNVRGLTEVALKATPLVLCALGLAVCYRANVWNIGAEGQFLLGAIVAGGVAAVRHDARHRGTAVGDDAGHPRCGHSRRDGVGIHHGALPRPIQRQRDPGEPDARVRGAAAPQLSRVRAVEGPAGLQLPADEDVRGGDAAAEPGAAVPSAHRLRDHARARGGVLGVHVPLVARASSCRSAGSRRTRRATRGSRGGRRCGRRSSFRAGWRGWPAQWKRRGRCGS